MLQQKLLDIYKDHTSVKYKLYPPNFHTYDWGEGRLKVLGLLNSDWDSEKDGGGFVCDGIPYKLEPTDFLIFDSNQTHANDTILSDKNRYAIDFMLTAK